MSIETLQWLPCDFDRPPPPHVKYLLFRHRGEYFRAGSQINPGEFFIVEGDNALQWITVCRRYSFYASFEGPKS